MVLNAGDNDSRRLTQLKALDLYRSTKLDIVDCLLACHAQRDGATLATFDKELRRRPDLEVYPAKEDLSDRG